MATTKTSLEARINNMLKASAPATNWLAANLDESIQQAMDELTRAHPYESRFDQAVGARELGLVAPSQLISVKRIWYPYLGTTTDYPPSWVDYEFWWENGAPRVLLLVDAAPDGTKSMRVYFDTPHTLNGLGGFALTSFADWQASLLATGACGYACLARSTELDETIANMAVSTPNYGALAELFFQRFHDMLYTNWSRGVEL